MGYLGKIEEKSIAISLRGKGLSYREINQRVNVSKDTLSRWCRGVILTPEQLESLRRKKLDGAERGRLIGAKRQQENRIARTVELAARGKKEVGRLSQRDRFIAGISLYIGDGLKGDRAVGFSNADPQAVKFILRWLREFCPIPENKFHGQIWIHEGLNEAKAKKFWSDLTKIPLKQFHKSYVAGIKPNSRKIRKIRHKYGIFAIRVSNAETQRKILGWESGILES